MKEFEIKVKAPEGKKPVYDEKSQTITFVPINIREQVKTFEDACKILDIPADKKICFSDSQLNAIMKLRIILKVLNEGHEFSLTEGDVWYPWVRFYEECKLPASEKKNIVRSFTLNGKGISSLAAALFMVLIPVSVASILTVGSAMPLPMSACLLVKIEKPLCM